MKKLIRYFNQNRKKILLILLIIVFLIILVRVLNYIVKTNIQEENNNISNTNTNRDTSIPSEAIISGEEIPEEEAREDKEIIDNFVNACNDKLYTNAYSMLSKECQDNVFNNNIDYFKNNYVDVVFETSKTYKLEGWLNKENMTYKITYINDNILATGSMENGLNYTDYITIDGKDEKINIFGFIDEVDSDITKTQNNITIQIVSIETYMNEVIYNILVSNNNEKTILLSDYSDNKQICLVDSNDIEYISYLNEIPQNNLIFEPGVKKEVSIKFSKSYSSSSKIEKMLFKNIYLDYEAYVNNEDTDNIEKIQFEINI